MKKAVSIVIIGLILLTAVSTAFAATTVSISKQTAAPGDTVTISGTANADENVAIKIVDSVGNIVYFGAVKADSNGNYSVSFTVPTDMVDGMLTVTAGSGNDTATVEISVVAPPTPTAQPTEKPTAQPTEKPTAKPTAQPTAASTEQPTEQPTTEPTTTPTELPTVQPTGQPTGNSEDETTTSGPVKVITPIESEQDRKTGDIMILIDTGDLPAGTVKIKLPDGTKIDIGNKETVEFTISADDIKADGIEIIALDDEGAPLSSHHVQIKDDDGQIMAPAENGWTGLFSTLLWILIGVFAIGVGLTVFIILKNKKSK